MLQLSLYQKQEFTMSELTFLFVGSSINVITHYTHTSPLLVNDTFTYSFRVLGRPSTLLEVPLYYKIQIRKIYSSSILYFPQSSSSTYPILLRSTFLTSFRNLSFPFQTGCNFESSPVTLTSILTVTL